MDEPNKNNKSYEKTSFADIVWDKNGQPISDEYDDVYFTKHNGLEESRYVFIQHNYLKNRWEALAQKPSNNEFVIGETGFGTGLNFLATWQLWDSIHNISSSKDDQKNQRLHFVSVEKHPLYKKDLERSLSLWPELKSYAEKLISVYNDYPSSGFKQFFLSESVTLTLIINEAVSGLNQLIESDHPWFRKAINNGRGIDAWFLDGFSPAKNPDMWSNTLFNIIAELSHPKTTLATFTAAGFVKRGLQNAGFTVKKEKGFGLKRELITASYSSASFKERNNNLPECKTHSFSSPYPVPWNVTPLEPPKHEEKNVTIIGAGLAGCHTAHALAKRGWKVTIIDAFEQPGLGASGNPQGIVYAKLSKDNDWLAQLNSACIPFAEKCYDHFWSTKKEYLGVEFGKQCGVLQIAYSENEVNIFQQLKAIYKPDKKNQKSTFENAKDNHIQFLTKEEASEIAGISINHSAIFFPKLGWLNPSLVCQFLIDHKNIQFIGNTVVTTLTEKKETDNFSKNTCPRWEVLDKNNSVVNTSHSIVIATASKSKKIEQVNSLPLKDIRGQITQLNTQNIHPQATIKTVICADGYIAPPTKDGNFTVGATFTLHNNDPAVTDIDNKKNLSSITESIPSLFPILSPPALELLEETKKGNMTGRTGFRCTTPDYLPIVGSVHNHQQFIKDYSLLKKNANASIPLQGHYYKNLFINVGYGSRGLAYTPLCSEYLASLMNGDIWPISRSLATALQPGRFTIKNLIRNKL